MEVSAGLRSETMAGVVSVEAVIVPKFVSREADLLER
jgi:hypothetical protein